MDNITVGQIVSACGSITAIAVFFIAIFNWYKKNVSDKFVEVDTKINEVNDRLSSVENYVENKEKEFIKELNDSKFERMILLRGELSALKGLQEIGCNVAVSNSIKEIEKYMMEKIHDYEG